LPIAFAAAVAVILGALFGGALHWKLRSKRRAVLSGTALTLAMLLEAASVLYDVNVMYGIACLAVAIAAAATRGILWRPMAKPFALKPEDAFRAPGFLEGRGLRGFALLTLLVIPAAFLAVRLRVLGPNAPILFAMNLTVLIPLFFTGGAPTPSRTLVKMLARLRRRSDLRVAPIGSTRGGEVRLLVQPKGAMPGLLGIEAREAHGFEVLARVREGSPSERLLRTASHASQMVIPGREADERVFSFVRSTAAAQALTVDSLVARLSERRARTSPVYTAEDRRGV
jgi:hypothetical protein